MGWKQFVRRQLAPLRLSPEREIEIVEEIALHLEAAYEDARADGLSDDDATARAIQMYDWQLLECELSRAEQTLAQPFTELIEPVGGMRMESWLQDIRFGLRTLAKKPGFTVVALLTLALGIGATTAIFSVVNAVLLKPLPYPEPEQLVMIYGGFPTLNQNRMAVSVPEFMDYRKAQSFAAVGAFDNGNLNLSTSDGGAPERVESVFATPETFTLLNVAPRKGRMFLPEEAQHGHDNVVLLSHALWQRRFGADESLVGKTILINGRPNTVVGVMPPGFAFPQQTELWKPLWFQPEHYDQQRRGSRGLAVLARIKTSVSFAQAQAEMDALSAQLTAQYPQNYGAQRRLQINLVPLLEDFVGDVRPALRVLMAAVLFVLLIACANVANLLLVRATGRRQEIAVRFALGAQRSRIVRQLLTESVLLALAGGALGLLLAKWGVQLLLQLAPENLPRFQQVKLDLPVLLFTIAASLLTGIVFGIIPALTASRTDLNATLKEGGRSHQAARHRVRDAFVIAQVAAALVLLIGAGLLMKSFWRLQAVEPGFDAKGVLTMRLLLPFETHRENAQRAAFYQQVIERTRAIPGVESVAAITRTPLLPGGPSGTVSGEGSVVGPADAPVEADRRWITPDYFQAMGITLINGRAFTEADTAGAAPVAIVDESFARKHWPNQDAVGKRIKLGRHESNNPWITVVGVVRHVKSQRIETGSNVQTYLPFYQDPSFFSMSLVVRTTVDDPLTLSNTVRAAIQSVERNQPVFLVKTMQQFVEESLAERRLTMLLMSVFAAVALLLAAIGLYGVMSYTVSQRTHELGLRLALGAQARDVMTLVLRQGMTLVVTGAALGLLAALGLTRLMQTVLFGVGAADWPTYNVIVVLLLLVALLACWLPARRATKVDPLIALRCD